MYLVLNVLETLLGVKINAQTNKTAYVEAVHDYMDIFIVRFFSIFKQFHVFFKLTQLYKKEQECLEILKGMTRQVIQQRQKKLLNTSSHKKEKSVFGLTSRA